MLSNLNIKRIVLVFVLCNVHSINNAQHLVGVKRNSVAQNYKFPTNSNQRFQGYSKKQIDKEEISNKKEQEKFKKEILKNHISKQSKTTQKRMKANLRISKKRNKRKPISPKWIIKYKRRKVLSQGKENKND